MVYQRFFWLILIPVLLIPAKGFARTTVLTLQQAIAEALASNPSIRAAQRRTDASRARVPQAKALDDPQVGVEFYNVPIDTADITRSDDIDYRVEQNIPFPGKRRMRGWVARHDAEVVAAQSGAEIRDQLLDLKTTYYELYHIDRSLEVNRENQALLGQLLGAMQTNYASGQDSADALLKLQVELSLLNNESIVLKQERLSHMVHLKALLNRSSHESLTIPRHLQWPRLKESLAEIIVLSLQTRPELSSLEAMEQRERARLTVAKQSYLPDFSVQFAYKQRPDDREDVWSQSTMINLPLFWGGKRGQVREARANLQATRAERESMLVHTHHGIEQAYSAFRAAEQLLNSYQNGILPQARTTLEVARTGYSSGKTGVQYLIDAARTHQNLQLSYYGYQALLGRRFAELERLVGREMQFPGGINEHKN